MKTFSPILIILILLFSCKKKEDVFVSSPSGTPGNTSVESFQSMDVEAGFNFRTSENITLTISDPSIAFYEIYYVSDENYKVASYNSLTNSGEINLVVPTYITELKLIRKSNGSTSNHTVFVNGNSADFAVNNNRVRKSGCTDVLYAVNNQGGFYSIDNTTGNYDITNLPNLTGGGSIACALDQDNGYVYYNVHRTMYRYDVNTGNFETVFTSNPFNGSYPRLEYKDGYFYMSNDQGKMKVVDAATNQVVQSYNITGFINNKTGGDLAFASDGQLYLACFSGLYRFTNFNDAANTATITRISAENFPYQLTSMAIDRNDDIYVGTVDNNSKLLRMSIQDGSHEIVKTYNHKINDLTAWRCASEDISTVDTDGDGVLDVDDDYPNDPDEAYDIFTPSELGWGSYAFEDLFPSYGDFDFNDLVVSYRAIQVANSSNEVARLKLIYKVKAIGASYKNGFAVQLPFSESLISNVSGYNITNSAVSLNSKGLENNQTSPVMVIFDNAFENGPYGACTGTEGDEITIDIDFNSPVSQSTIALNNFNYFIFRTEERGHEVHLKNYYPTDLADLTLFDTFDDGSSSPGAYYVSKSGLPWGLHIIHNFRQMKEREDIIFGYNYFVNWAQSNGNQYQDWYKDNSGYRNTSKICLE